ncbi:hypothetical protein F3Y22_tig00110458pilonHSYRG00113 [Hibiscus syriacus]|uniref:Uncharacterized protein n=1 Tax=Hibiscus syriacus TaxID=106335 RepID=A0A6A3AMV7_HIBSY|nr:hypothetical protein F3Y22_tig00110458pilonHSYRG00113 [Hibiscus syriacus]
METVDGRLAKALSLMLKHSLAVSWSLTIKALRTAILMVNIGPYFSAISPRIAYGGLDPFMRWRWPITGHEFPASGASLFLFLAFFNIHTSEERKTIEARMVEVDESE